MSKPEWKEISPNVFWCKGCGSIRLGRPSEWARYFVPRRERERREHDRWLIEAKKRLP